MQDRERTAAELVAALWSAGSAGPWTPEPPPGLVAADLYAGLEQCANDAEYLAAGGAAAERPAARLLAETARAALAALGGDPRPTGGRSDGGHGVLPSAARRRLARMERWLAERAAVDAAAQPAADLCLWVLERLETDAP